MTVFSSYTIPPPPPPPPFAAQRFPHLCNPPPTWGTSSDGLEQNSSTSENVTEPKVTVKIGMTAEPKNLYRENCREPWEEWAPEDVGAQSLSTSDSDKFAIIVRREKQDGDNGEPSLALHSIKVQSPLIKARLHPVFKDYKGINTHLKKLEFNAPFREFFYRWTEFLQAKPQEDADEEEKIHFDLLFQVILPEILPHIEQATDLLKNNSMSFDYLWTLFEPDTEIYSEIDGEDRLLLLNSGRYVEYPGGMKMYSLSCRYVDNDGETFGYAATTLTIAGFSGYRPISELNVVASHLKEGIDSIRSSLQERGSKFAALIGCHYKEYTGLFTFANVPVGDTLSRHIENGRIMIDGKSFKRYNERRVPDLEPLDLPASSDHLDSIWSFANGDDDQEDMFLPREIRMVKQMVRQARRRFVGSRQQSKASNVLSKEFYSLCHSRVRGYCLKNKQWATFKVNSVSDIVWNTMAFKQLVLPHGYKDIVWAFVDAQLSQQDDFDDIIKGKGKGMIMLLSGEPGTGKTLTSESVAEAMEKPLYALSAGELGLTADEVEGNLGRVLELSKRWKAVLLLDECDVFLEKRSTSDLHRNKLVSVFLRLLEYYKGVMFLTTNRLDTFDPAFESRIDLTLMYPSLDFESRLHVWTTFVQPETDKSSITREELKPLASATLNGRQIKNVVKTARLLASREKIPLAIKHLETVLEVKKIDITAFQADENQVRE